MTTFDHFVYTVLNLHYLFTVILINLKSINSSYLRILSINYLITTTGNLTNIDIS